MRILSFPASRKANDNPYHNLIFSELATRHEVADYRKLVPLQSADIFHIHWLEYIFRGRLADKSEAVVRAQIWNLNNTIERVRQRGALVWTAHNLHPHEGFGASLSGLWTKELDYVLRRVDIAIAMSESHIPMLERTYRQVRQGAWRVAVHPNYIDYYNTFENRPQARQRRRIQNSDFVICMAGLVRPYKRIVEAIRIFRECARPDEKLIVAGACSDASLRMRVLEAAAGSANILLELRHQSDFEFATLHKLSDVSLFNFTNSLNSGSLIAALSLGTRIFAPRHVVPEELLAVDRSGLWVETYSGELDPSSLRAGLDRMRSRECVGVPDLSAYSAANVARQHEQAYMDALQYRAAARG